MKISSESFVYKTAYVFTDADKRPMGYINGCSLFWRFIFFGGIYVFLTTILFPMILAFSLVIMLFRWIGAISIGHKLEHYRRALSESDWMDVVLNNVWMRNYRSVRINSWPTFFGWRILPIGILGVLLAGFMLVATVYLNWVLGQAAAKGHGMAFATILIELLLVSLIVFAFSIPRLRKSAVVRLVSANLKSFKDRTCPVVEIV